jgi:DNA-binding response OmpR family regulator
MGVLGRHAFSTIPNLETAQRIAVHIKKCSREGWPEKSMKILVIDDDAEIVEYITIACNVGMPGVKVVSTHQGRAGIELVKTERPDAIILDLGLPDMSGFEALKQIRTFSKVPIIIESVASSEANIVKGLEWGADEYLVKPFGQFEFLARIKSLWKNALDPVTITKRNTITTGAPHLRRGQARKRK